MLKIFTLTTFALSSFSLMASTATLVSPSMKDLKTQVTITEEKDGAKVVVHASGLKAHSVHGIHVHEKGLCEGPDFKSAGEHFNPHGKAHGSPASGNRHIGDLGNLKANAEGVAHAELNFRGISASDVKSLIGKSVILHAKADDLKSQPSGESGDRIACGVIK